MLKPFGAFNLSSGSLFSAVASGGAGTGASFAAAGLPSRRPISGEPGGSAAAAGGAGPGAGAARQAPALALQQERALARACPAVVGPALSWLEERVSRPATCRAVRVES